MLHLTVLAACVVVPWLLHFTVGWWAGLVSWFALGWLYTVVVVPRGSICMGIPFGFALSSLAALVLLDIVLLIRWCISLL
jgi:hypothetical protein